MEFSFTESVKLATKGYKPSDIAELSKLDENKFSKDDILSLISNGYSKSEVKTLVETFSSKETEEKPQDDTDGQDGQPKDAGEKETESASSQDDAPEKKDDIDYKKKYEEEKKLREELQHKKAVSSSEKKGDNRSDWDIAMEIAEMY